jgi:hypothetical protein
MTIVDDCEFRELMLTGRPGAVLPRHKTVSRDVQASFEKCREHITQILNVIHICWFVICAKHMFLQEHPGQVHFATAAWTLPNHRAFVAWTIYFECEGNLLSFFLDILEVPEVCNRQSATGGCD